MIRSVFATMALLSGIAAAADLPMTPSSGRGVVVVPRSSQPMAGDAGLRMRTHVRLFIPSQAINPDDATPTGYYFETPASLACVYQLVAVTAGCVPGSVTKLATGGSRAVAIVDAYDTPTIASDLATYSTKFGLPAATLTVVYATGTKPAQDPTGGWELETSLDVEMVHALAPKAKIFLIEAASDSLTDLLAAVKVANTKLGTVGGGEVSMSWGGDEFSTESSYDTNFAATTVVYVAATGDSPGVSWPATSAKVLAAGGTSISRHPTTGAFISEASWSEGGGGPSAYIPAPSFQSAVASLTGTKRAIPDVAAVGNPDTGVWVYDSFPYEGEVLNWTPVGGTSVATPVIAAIINAAAGFHSSSAAENGVIYGRISGSSTTGLNLISRGICGPYAGYSASGVWNPCVGLGSPISTKAF